MLAKFIAELARTLAAAKEIERQLALAPDDWSDDEWNAAHRECEDGFRSAADAGYRAEVLPRVVMY